MLAHHNMSTAIEGPSLSPTLPLQGDEALLAGYCILSRKVKPRNEFTNEMLLMGRYLSLSCLVKRALGRRCTSWSHHWLLRASIALLCIRFESLRAAIFIQWVQILDFSVARSHLCPSAAAAASTNSWLRMAIQDGDVVACITAAKMWIFSIRFRGRWEKKIIRSCDASAP